MRAADSPGALCRDSSHLAQQQRLRFTDQARIGPAKGLFARSMWASRLDVAPDYVALAFAPPSMSVSKRRSRPPLVLIANDQDWSARSLESVLGPRGYAALRVATSVRTLELARIAQPDAIILDMALPDL